MPMRVIHIRHTRMDMDHLFVPMRMAVGAIMDSCMVMHMMSVVMRVGLPFRQMQDHAGQHQRPAHACPNRFAARVERDGDVRPDERRKR